MTVTLYKLIHNLRVLAPPYSNRQRHEVYIKLPDGSCYSPVGYTYDDYTNQIYIEVEKVSKS